MVVVVLQPAPLHGPFIIGNGADDRRVAQETGFENGRSGRELRILLQIGHFQVPAKGDRSRIVVFLSCQNIQQGSFSRAVFCDQPYALSLADA